MDNLLHMKDITKVYPGIIANNRVSLEVRGGEVHALLGENGAGKTTLMNVLYGMTIPDEGEIRWQGRPIHIASPKDAIEHGIGMVHQHIMLVNRFTALQNIVLGMRDASRVWLDLKAAERRARELADRFGLDIDFQSRVEGLPLGTQQRLEILKALYRGARLLILDEPTSVLAPSEVESLFEILKRLVEQNHSVIFISHKLEEVLAISDRVTVLRDGRNMATLNAAEASQAQLAELMVGRPVVFQIEKTPPHPTSQAAIEVEDVRLTRQHGRDQLHGVSLHVQAGEILGIAGIDGNGQRALWEVLCGITRPTGGRVKLLGRDTTRYTPRQMAKLNVARIPEDRSSMGLLMPMSIWENLMLEIYSYQPCSRRGLLRSRYMIGFARQLMGEYDIRAAGVEVTAGTLSGGNQQKVILARELHRAPQALLVANATRGLDVGATEYTYRRLLERRDQGAGILLISSDLEEVLALSDRVAVMHGGRIMGEVEAARADRLELGLMMTGMSLDAARSHAS